MKAAKVCRNKMRGLLEKKLEMNRIESAPLRQVRTHLREKIEIFVVDVRDRLTMP